MLQVGACRCSYAHTRAKEHMGRSREWSGHHIRDSQVTMLSHNPRNDKAMVIDGATGRILADKYKVKLNGTAKRQREVASAIAQKGFFAVRFSADCFLPGGRQDGHLQAFPGTSAPVSLVAVKLANQGPMQAPGSGTAGRPAARLFVTSSAVEF